MIKKIFLLLLFSLIIFPKTAYAIDTNEYSDVSLSKCVDSTSARFILNETEIKVKFLGIDTVSTVNDTVDDEINGSSIDDYVCSSLKEAKKIKIEYEPNSEREDKYGRVLAWIYVDDILLQEDLVKLGYAKVAYLYDNYSYSDNLKEAESYAKENKLGVWMETEKVNTNIEEEKEEREDNKTFVSMIFNYINEIFEKFLKFIDDLINDIL